MAGGRKERREEGGGRKECAGWKGWESVYTQHGSGLETVENKRHEFE